MATNWTVFDKHGSVACGRRWILICDWTQKLLSSFHLKIQSVTEAAPRMALNLAAWREAMVLRWIRSSSQICLDRNRELSSDNAVPILGNSPEFRFRTQHRGMAFSWAGWSKRFQKEKLELFRSNRCRESTFCNSQGDQLVLCFD